MVGILEKAKKILHQPLQGKKFPVSGGTVLFILFNFLLITGFCKFSFYVLKNHRSAVDRESLVNTYVDVQPYRTTSESFPSYLTMDSEKREAPAPFFKESVKKETPSFLSEKIAVQMPPVPVLEKSEERSAPVISFKTPVRPPVIRQHPSSSVIAKEASPSPAPLLEEDGSALHGLMTSGQTLLHKSEEQIAATELLLQKETADSETKKTESEKPIVVAEKNITLPEPKEVTEKHSDSQNKTFKTARNNSTRWLDAAELRRQLAEKTAQKLKQAEISSQNEALLRMNDAKQIASSDVETFSNLHPAVPAASKETLKDTAKENALQTEPSSALPVKKETDSAPEKLTREDPPSAAPQTETIQTAAVQKDSLTDKVQPPEEVRQPLPDKKPAIKRNTALSGTAPDLWKVASVRNNAFKTSSAAQKATKETEKEQIPAEKTESLPKKEAIYRHGREIPVIKKESEQKSLNWLDRKEAAVWTSMSQSDTPSVWSAETEPLSSNPDRAKAFRVADEQGTESNIVNSAPVRVIGEEEKPEAIENPLLLPLGAQNVNPSAKITAPKSSPAPVIPGTSASVPKTNPNGFSPLPSEQQVVPDKKDSSEDTGIMNKFFSFFGKNDTSDNSLPSIGSGTPVKTDEDKNKEQNKSAEKSISSQNKQKEAKSAVPAKKVEEKPVLPTELRLTFKPNSSEMSAQSIKWIKSFGQRAKKDIQNAVEVRMSNADPALQDKRFALIQSTLIGAGMEEVQIIPVMTDRTPHTIVLRMIVLPEEGYTEYTTDQNGVKERLYYKQW